MLWWQLMLLHRLHLLYRSVESLRLLVHLLLILVLRIMRRGLLVSLWLGLTVCHIAAVWLLLYFVNHFLLGDKFLKERFNFLASLSHAIVFENDWLKHLLRLHEFSLTVVPQSCNQSVNLPLIHLLRVSRLFRFDRVRVTWKSWLNQVDFYSLLRCP